MSMREQETKLFDRWEKSGKYPNGFYRDGLVSENDYLNSDPKIVLVLKEANADDSGDIRHWLRDFSKPGNDPTWNNAAWWVHGIRNRKSLPKWKDFPNAKVEFKKEAIKSICAMNLKKDGGNDSADFAEVAKFARDDCKFIQEQYALYNPKLTICCGVGDLFKEVAGHCAKKWEYTSRGISYWKWGEENYVISFYHPARRIQSHLKLFSLIDAVNEIYDKK